MEMLRKREDRYKKMRTPGRSRTAYRHVVRAMCVMITEAPLKCHSPWMNTTWWARTPDKIATISVVSMVSISDGRMKLDWVRQEAPRYRTHSPLTAARTWSCRIAV